MGQRRFHVFERRVRRGLGAVRQAVRRLTGRVRAVETTLDPLVDHVAFAEEKLQDIDARVTRLERGAAHRGRRERAS